MRRIFWLALGLGAGATVGLAATRWARRKTEAFAPAALGRQVAAVASDTASLLKEAAAEFRAGMAEHETEIRSAVEAGRPENEQDAGSLSEVWPTRTDTERWWQSTRTE